jgi:hypothetical protein
MNCENPNHGFFLRALFMFSNSNLPVASISLSAGLTDLSVAQNVKIEMKIKEQSSKGCSERRSQPCHASGKNHAWKFFAQELLWCLQTKARSPRISLARPYPDMLH